MSAWAKKQGRDLFISSRDLREEDAAMKTALQASLKTLKEDEEKRKKYHSDSVEPPGIADERATSQAHKEPIQDGFSSKSWQGSGWSNMGTECGATEHGDENGNGVRENDDFWSGPDDPVDPGSLRSYREVLNRVKRPSNELADLARKYSSSSEEQPGNLTPLREGSGTPQANSSEHCEVLNDKSFKLEGRDSSHGVLVGAVNGQAEGKERDYEPQGRSSYAYEPNSGYGLQNNQSPLSSGNTSSGHVKERQRLVGLETGSRKCSDQGLFQEPDVKSGKGAPKCVKTCSARMSREVSRFEPEEFLTSSSGSLQGSDIQSDKTPSKDVPTFSARKSPEPGGFVPEEFVTKDSGPKKTFAEKFAALKKAEKELERSRSPSPSLFLPEPIIRPSSNPIPEVDLVAQKMLQIQMLQAELAQITQQPYPVPQGIAAPEFQVDYRQEQPELNFMNEGTFSPAAFQSVRFLQPRSESSFQPVMLPPRPSMESQPASLAAPVFVSQRLQTTNQSQATSQSHHLAWQQFNQSEYNRGLTFPNRGQPGYNHASFYVDQERSSTPANRCNQYAFEGPGVQQETEIPRGDGSRTSGELEPDEETFRKIMERVKADGVGVDFVNPCYLENEKPMLTMRDYSAFSQSLARNEETDARVFQTQWPRQPVMASEAVRGNSYAHHPFIPAGGYTATHLASVSVPRTVPGTFGRSSDMLFPVPLDPRAIPFIPGPSPDLVHSELLPPNYGHLPTAYFTPAFHAPKVGPPPGFGQLDSR